MFPSQDVFVPWQHKGAEEEIPPEQQLTATQRAQPISGPQDETPVYHRWAWGGGTGGGSEDSNGCTWRIVDPSHDGAALISHAPGSWSTSPRIMLPLHLTRRWHAFLFSRCSPLFELNPIPACLPASFQVLPCVYGRGIGQAGRVGWTGGCAQRLRQV